MIRGILCTGQLLHSLPTISIRYYAPRGRASVENPGISRRMKLFEKEQLEDQFDDPDDLEADFMNSHQSHREAQKEAAQHKEKLGTWIVRNKYFNSHTANLLTYAEKEQIRHLHDSDREEWTVEKLASSFPATEDTIRKIIKAKWIFRDAKNIQRHDDRVKRNWDALRSGSVPGIDERLREHLMKFADREFEPEMMTGAVAKRNLLELPKGEFSEIITSCKMVQKPLAIAATTREANTNQSPPIAKYGSNTMVLEGVTDRRPMTIELFRDAAGIFQPSTTGTTTSPAQASQAHIALGSRTGKVQMAEVPSQFKAAAVKPFDMLERITIPKKLRRRGATYKVEDSYFDDDGEFLYRVPGMTK